jgi:hypothetical protein
LTKIAQLLTAYSNTLLSQKNTRHIHTDCKLQPVNSELSVTGRSHLVHEMEDLYMGSDLLGNIVGCVVLFTGTLYQLFFNKMRYDKDIKRNIDKLTALHNKTDRNHTATTFMFVGLMVSYIIFIFGEIYGRK